LRRFIIISLLLTIVAIAQTPIAIIDFEGKEISQSEASALTDRLRNELINNGHYKVVERDMMEEILQEQGFQQSGCTSNECIVEVGRLIGVEKIVGGSISKVGNLYSVSARIVSVETGEVLKAVSYDHGGKLSDLLKTGMKDVALELVGQKRVKVPSVAIIPLNNKGEKVDDFYAWGISADLISDVSGAGLIRVASLRQIEELGDIPIEEIARKLFVRYVATGTLWKIENVFQLSLELYDTKESKVIWSDRWQEEWENLPSIKGKLAENILNTLNVTTTQEVAKAPTINTEAYEFYLKGKYRYEKRENMEDTEIARGLFRKAIELDDNLIAAKNLLGGTYSETGDYDKAMEIYTFVLKQADESGDKSGIGDALNNIGIIYDQKGDYDKALDYYTRSLDIAEELGDKRGIGKSLNNIGIIYRVKGDYDKALDYYTRSLAIKEELGDKSGMGASLNNIGLIYDQKGDYDKALDYYTRSLDIAEELGDKRVMIENLTSIEKIYFDKGDYTKSIQMNEKAIELHPDYAAAYSRMGYAYELQGNLTKAIKYYQKAIELNPENAFFYDNMGNAYYDLGERTKAEKYYQKAIELKPDLPETIFNQALTTEGKNRRFMEIRLYKEAARLGHQGAQDWLKKNGYDW